MQCLNSAKKFRVRNFRVLSNYGPSNLNHWLLHARRVSIGSRSFSQSPPLYKNKKDKAKPASSEDSQPKPLKPGTAPQDPLDLSQLQDGITTAVSRLKDELSKLRVGGRANTESIESLRIRINKGSKEMVKLGDLAQVVPKGGRMVTILASEEIHIKPISSAIISSNLSLTPQPDPHNSLQLNIPIPPPTKESRDQAIVSAKAAMERAASMVRDSRGVVHKRLQEMSKKKIARPDDARKTQDKMEKLAEKGQNEVKDLFEAVKKVMERA